MSEPEFISFSAPDVGESEAQAVADAVRSGWLTSGPVMKTFESDFANYLGEGINVLAVSSATAGLHLALEAMGVEPGDEVIVPTWTFTATAEVVRYLGATPVLVDVDSETLNIAPSSVADAITERTRAVIPVHFAGLSADLQGIRSAISGRRIAVLEDAAHALPTVGADGLIGTSHESDAAVFSFYATKTLTTGEGGLIATRKKALAHRASVMRLHGIDRDAFARYSSEGANWFYDVVAPGFKYNMSDLSAALGRVQLKRVDQMRARRQAIADHYMQEFADLPIQLPAQAPKQQQHSWHLFVIRLIGKGSLSREEFMQGMLKSRIGTSVHYRPLHEHSYWRQFVLERLKLPNASAASQSAVSLPISSALSDRDVERTVEATRCLLQ